MSRDGTGWLELSAVWRANFGVWGQQEGDSLHLRAALPLQPLVIAIALTRGSAGDGTPLPPPPPGTLAADRLVKRLCRGLSQVPWAAHGPRRPPKRRPSCMHSLRACCPPYGPPCGPLNPVASSQ